MNRVLWWVELRRKTLTNLKMPGQSHVFETFAELSPPHCILAKAASTYFFKTMPAIQSISSPGWRLSAVDQLLKVFRFQSSQTPHQLCQVDIDLGPAPWVHDELLCSVPIFRRRSLSSALRLVVFHLFMQVVYFPL